MTNSARKAVEKLVENVDNIRRNVGNTQKERGWRKVKKGENETFQKEKNCNLL